MEKKIIIFCVAVGFIMVGIVCGVKIFDTLSTSPNAAVASVATSENDQNSSPNTPAAEPKRAQTKEFETYHDVEPIPDLVTLMLATPDKK